MNGTHEPVACIIGTSSVQLWGLDGAERLRRQLRTIGIERIVHDGDTVTASASILLLRGDYVFDERTLRDLVKAPDTLLLAGASDRNLPVVAAHITAASLPQTRAILNGTAAPQTLPGATVQTPETLSSAYLNTLLKTAPPLLLPIRPERAAALERYLFAGSYKGVTDLVTKWVWPTPARWFTRVCVQLGIGPNAVTATSLVLAIATMVFFARSQFGTGLLVAWVMTFLDTVDGKLARVTVTSTRFGHIFDHAIDLIHPPLWYLAWGYGVAPQLRTVDAVLVAIVGGYVVGRLVEGVFDFLLAGFSMFTWRPMDSYFRLITARRNPNLLLLTVFALAHLPRWGLIAVAYWTVLSTAFLAIRLGQAAYARVRHGRLRSWLQDLGDDIARAPAYARPFIPNSALPSHVA